MSEPIKKQPEYIKILGEMTQHYDTRKKYYRRLEEIMGMPVLSYLTSFRYPVSINDEDVVLFEDILQKMDVTKGLALLINSPGGSGESAERIVNICRSNSGTGTFKAIVLGKAKSAATIICFGAEEIIMTKSAELGPIDPQVYLKDRLLSAYNLITTYKELFKEAVQTKGNLEPFLQQLQHFDAFDIKEFQSWMALSQDIAIKLLKGGMMSKCSESEIEKNLNKFLIPEETKTHSRPIYAKDCVDCGLNIKVVNKEDPNKFWKNIYRLYFRLYNVTNNMKIAKILENKDISLTVRSKDN